MTEKSITEELLLGDTEGEFSRLVQETALGLGVESEVLYFALLQVVPLAELHAYARIAKYIGEAEEGGYLSVRPLAETVMSWSEESNAIANSLLIQVLDRAIEIFRTKGQSGGVSNG